MSAAALPCQTRVKLQPHALPRVYEYVALMTVGEQVRERLEPQPSDAELARLVAEGDRRAAAVLVQRHQLMVRAFLYRLTGRDDLADDLAQETFVRVLRYAERYDSRYPMRAWLLTIARRLWINHLRRSGRLYGPARRPMDLSPATEQIASSAPGPAEQASRNDDQALLHGQLAQALQEISESQRTAVLLFHQQELTLEEAAKVMKMPIGTIKSHLHRGRAALRRLLSAKQKRVNHES